VNTNRTLEQFSST